MELERAKETSAYIFTRSCFSKVTPKVTTFGVFAISLNKCHHISLPHVGTRGLSRSGNVAIHQRDRRYHRVGRLVNLTHMACRPELRLAPRRCPAVHNMRAVADSVRLFLRYGRFHGYRQPSTSPSRSVVNSAKPNCTRGWNYNRYVWVGAGQRERGRERGRGGREGGRTSCDHCNVVFAI